MKVIRMIDNILTSDSLIVIEIAFALILGFGFLSYGFYLLITQ